MRPNIRKKDGENLTNPAIELVITKLESDKPITKKAACAELRITYNTSRLQTIIDKYKVDKAFMAKRKKELRNTLVSEGDASYMVSSYLEGTALQDIADTVFRSVAVVKRILKKYNIPTRNASVTYHNPIDLGYEVESPTDYVAGDLVYSARYDCPAEIRSIFSNGVYSVWLFGPDQYAYQPSYELADLRRVQKELSVELEYMKSDECIQEVQLALRNARKKVKE